MLSADKENNFIYKLVANEREISEHTSNYQNQAVIKVFADVFVRMSKMQECRLQYMQVIGTPPLGPGLSHCSGVCECELLHKLTFVLKEYFGRFSFPKGNTLWKSHS